MMFHHLLQAIEDWVELLELEAILHIEKLLERNHHHRHHHRVVSQHQAVPSFRIKGGSPMSAAFNLPFDQIATVNLFATRASGQITNALPGSTVTSDNPAITVALAANGNSYTATATSLTGSATVSLAPPAGSSVPVDTLVITIVDDAVVSQTQDSANATFAPNPNPPTA